MRKSYSSYSLVTLAGLFLAGSCSIIAEVDRTKIPQDDGPPGDGGQGTGGTSTGGMSGSSGTSGTSGTGPGGAGGEPGGMGGEAGEATGGTSTGGTGGTMPGGMGGEGGTPGALCGDGTIDAGEDCDDDNEMDGDGCDSDCNEEAGWNCVGTTISTCTPICGDGIDVGAAEVCDDGNTLACGTCAGNSAGTAPGCTAIVVPAPAIGTIAAIGGADLVDEDTFVIGDGTVSVTFEFDNDANLTTTGSVGITYTGTEDADAVGALIVDAINNRSTLGITAAGTSAITLTNQTPTALGNQTITEAVTHAGFVVTGMAGGRGRDCPQTTGCTVDEVCASGSCNSSSQCAN